VIFLVHRMLLLQRWRPQDRWPIDGPLPPLSLLRPNVVVINLQQRLSGSRGAMCVHLLKMEKRKTFFSNVRSRLDRSLNIYCSANQEKVNCVAGPVLPERPTSSPPITIGFELQLCPKDDAREKNGERRKRSLP